MGFFDFVKEAGEKLFGSGAEDEKKPDATAIVKSITEHGLKIERLRVQVNEDQATVMGTVESQDVREKAVLCCGNVKGIARVDDQLEVKEPAPEATFYTVVSGDSLSKIAKTQYGDAMKYPVIFEANKPMLTDPDKIYPGQVLRIPPQA